MMKNDIDLVAETHQRVVFNALRQLAIKLYKRNPQEWKKAGQPSLEMAVKTITANPLPLTANISNIEQIRLAFDERYQGDRVKAYIVGLEAMVLASYDNHRSFYIHHMLEAQKLYDSARNIELASWLIRKKYKSNGKLFLLSSVGTPEINLSFERLFGKMINAQDMMAQIVADRSHRQIKNIIQSVATAFIPI
ncbi:MAG TPA: hypothetical protein EYQ57_03295 [Methylococcaceae bacterium]|nr:hypothetical protein [Methylococcaceae bacterium]